MTRFYEAISMAVYGRQYKMSLIAHGWLSVCEKARRRGRTAEASRGADGEDAENQRPLAILI